MIHSNRISNVKRFLRSRVMRGITLLFVCWLGSLLFFVSPGAGVNAREHQKLYTTDPTVTPWHKSKNARSRLLSAHIVSDPKAVLAGIEIRLREKWKTYWRVPGDAGIPPRFDFSGSENLEKAEVLWPAPNRYTDQFGVAIGYKDRVIFPLRLTPIDPKKPIKFSVKLDYAACEIVCIPLQAKHDMFFKLGESLKGNQYEAIQQFMAQVPISIKESKNLKIIGIKFVGQKNEASYLRLDLRSKIGFRQPEIFIEGPEGLYFRTPKLDQRPTVVARWKVPITGNLEETPLAGKMIKLTFIDGDRRIEADYKIKEK